MRRYFRIYREFVRSSLQRELEFRTNFFAKMFQSLIWVLFFVLIVLVVYRNTDSVAGWNRGESMVLAATVFLLTAVFNGLCFSLYDIPEQVRRGTLDFVVSKPIDAQFWVSLRRCGFEQIGPIIAGIGLLVYGISTSGHQATVAGWASFLLLFTVGSVLYYSLSLSLMTLGIWLVRVENLWVLGEIATSVARYPLDIFQPMARRILTLYIPLGFIAYVPVKHLLRGPDMTELAIGLGWGIAAFCLSRRYWLYAMRHYTSASS